MSSTCNGSGKKVVVALSGGIDSSVSAYLLKKEGFEVVGVTGIMFESEQSNAIALRAKNIADKLGIEHHVLNLSEDFKKNVTDYFENSYRQGFTPNPCIKCNKFIKWGKIFDWAKSEIGADFYATGHYARLVKKDGLYLLYPADDARKDQIYYLFELTQDKLSQTMFPLCGYTKEEIKKTAFELGFAQEKEYKESQDICFIPKTMNTQKYLLERFGKNEGDFVLINNDKRVGIHNGFYQYTIGQRKGVGVAYTEPLYVVDIDADKNIVYLGTREYLYKSELELHDFNFIDTTQGNEFEAYAKIRNNMPYQKVLVKTDGAGNVNLQFETPVSAVTNGQAAVLYDKNDKHLIGGAWIGY